VLVRVQHLLVAVDDESVRNAHDQIDPVAIGFTLAFGASTSTGCASGGDAVTP